MILTLKKIKHYDKSIKPQKVLEYMAQKKINKSSTKLKTFVPLSMHSYMHSTHSLSTKHEAY